MAPGMLPIPPITAAIKHFRPGIIPISGAIRGNLMLHVMAPTAANAEPTKKVKETTWLTLMPINVAISTSQDTALIARPIFVLYTK